MIKWIEIDTKAIENNIKIIKSKLEKSKLMVVVKANGYGHGADEISKIAEKNKVNFLGVMSVYEALKLKTPLDIMIFSPSLREDIDLILKNNFIITADSMDFIKELNRRARKPVRINIDIDTGLRRWGVRLKDAFEFSREIKKFKNIKLFSLSTHIAYTPYKNKIEAQEKLERFKEITQKIKEIYPDIIVHAANSLVFLDFPDYYFDMVRIGNLIYGIFPKDVYLKRENEITKLIKKPWKFYSKIISVNYVKKGESFGYASEIVATRNMRIATIPVGYSDGLGMEPVENVYQITEGKTYWAEINGKKAYFVSKPAISHTIIDITNIPEANVGSIVSLAIRRTAANAQIPRIYR